jgi:hypothetical protein
MKALLDLSEDHTKVLHLLMTRIPGHLDWALTGSAGLRLQGVDVPVHDLDLESHPAGVDEIAHIFGTYLREMPHWKEGQRLRSYFGVLVVEGIQVELMGDIQHWLPDGSWSPVADIPTLRRRLAWQGRQVPVLDLAYEAQAYEELGRTEKAARIREVLCPKSLQ